jgi:thiol-disulfide isomerase/thioredoxin
MKWLRFAMVYTVVTLCANVATATDLTLQGEMRKLTVHSSPRAISHATFTDLNGNSHSLADYHGKLVLLNLWATWCAPCRKEMPGLASLQTEFGGEDFAVVTVATGRNLPDQILKFFKQEEINNLPDFIDPKQSLAQDMAVLGLPTTIIIDKNGYEIARFRGDADWNGPYARNLIQKLLIK